MNTGNYDSHNTFQLTEFNIQNNVSPCENFSNWPKTWYVCLG